MIPKNLPPNLDGYGSPVASLENSYTPPRKFYDSYTAPESAKGKIRYQIREVYKRMSFWIKLLDKYTRGFRQKQFRL